MNRGFVAALAFVSAAWAFATAACGGATSGVCEGNAKSAACDCDSERKRSDGTCCPSWQRAAGNTCEARALEQPATLRSLGEPGARSPVLAVNERGELIVAWTSMDATNRSRLYVAETSDALSTVAVRQPGATFAGGSIQPTVTGGLGRRFTVAWKQERSSEDARIFVAERDDGGVWSEPTREEDAFSFAPRAFEPILLTTTRGETVLVWNQWYGKNYGAQIARRLAGQAWERPTASDQVVSNPYYYVNAPKLAASAAGDILVSWYQAAPDEKLMAFSSERRGESGRFSVSTGHDYLSAGGGDVGGQGGGSPKPAMSPSGHAAVAWAQENETGQTMTFVATHAPGADWERPKSRADFVSPPSGKVDLVQTAYGSRGTLYVVWTQGDQAGTRVYALRRNSDGSWRDPPGRPVELSTPGLRAQSVTIAAGRDGAIAVAWIELDSGGSALRMRRTWDGEDWLPVETIAGPERRADSPVLAFGGRAERLAVAWTEGVASRVYVAVMR